MDTDQLRLATATGVDVTLEIAGPGTRTYGFLNDWILRSLLALAWWISASLLTAGRLGATRARLGDHFLWVIVPPLLIYFLYHPVLEVLMSGRTPGKRMAGVRIATQLGGTPSVGALLVRNVFRLIDCLPSFYMLGLVTCIFSSQRVRFGDMAAGTLLVRDADRRIDGLAQMAALSNHSGLDLDTLEVVTALLTRWPQLADDSRRDLARSILRQVLPPEQQSSLDAMRSRDLRARLSALVGATSA